MQVHVGGQLIAEVDLTGNYVELVPPCGELPDVPEGEKAVSVGLVVREQGRWGDQQETEWHDLHHRVQVGRGTFAPSQDLL